MNAIPSELVDQSTEEFVGDRVKRQDDTESPGSGGASPYLPAASPMNAIPFGMAHQSTEEFIHGGSPQKPG